MGILRHRASADYYVFKYVGMCILFIHPPYNFRPELSYNVYSNSMNRPPSFFHSQNGLFDRPFIQQTKTQMPSMHAVRSQLGHFINIAVMLAKLNFSIEGSLKIGRVAK